MTVSGIRYQERRKVVGVTELHFGDKMSYLADSVDVLGDEGKRHIEDPLNLSRGSNQAAAGILFC